MKPEQKEELLDLILQLTNIVKNHFFRLNNNPEDMNAKDTISAVEAYLALTNKVRSISEPDEQDRCDHRETHRKNARIEKCLTCGYILQEL